MTTPAGIAYGLYQAGGYLALWTYAYSALRRQPLTDPPGETQGFVDQE